MTNAERMWDFIRPATPPVTGRRHLLAGTVSVDGKPGKRLISVFDRRNMTWLASTYSLADGTWRISGLPEYPERSLLVIAFDNTGAYNAEAADYITQV